MYIKSKARSCRSQVRISKINHDEEEEAWGASKNKCKIIIITRYMVSEVLQCSDSNSQIHNHKAFSLGFLSVDVTASFGFHVASSCFRF